MASLKFSIPLDSYDSKKSNSPLNSSLLLDRFSFLSISGFVHVSSRPSLLHSSSTIKHLKVSQIEQPELSDRSESKPVHVEGSRHDRNLGFQHERWKRNRGVKQGGGKKEVGPKFGFKPNDLILDNELENLFVNSDELDVNYSAIGSDLSLDHCNTILKRLQKFNDSKALNFFEWMKINGKVEHNVDAYNIILRVLATREDWDEAEKMIQELSHNLGTELDFKVFNTLIYACYKLGHFELGAKWFRMMLKNQVQPNIATFGMLMALYQKSWNIEEAEFAFTKMRDFGIVCETAYSSMITIYTRLRLYNKAEEVISLMREDEVKANLENWLVVLNAYCQQGKLKEAEMVLRSMEEAGFSPNIIAYNTLITGYGKMSDMSRAQQLFSSIKDILGIEPDETTYRSMIEGWGRVGNFEKAQWYYNELKRLGYQPNSSNLYTLIGLQAKYGDEKGANDILEDMVEIRCHYSSILSTVLQAYERTGSIENLPRLLKGSFFNHVLINQTSCSSLVLSYVKHGLVNDAISVMSKKKWNDKPFEENLYHLLICSCKELGHFDNAIKIYSQISKSPTKPNLHIICTMIDIYTIMGRFSEGEKLYFILRSSQIPLDMVAFSIVVRMYIKAGSLEEACSVLDIMEKLQDIVPDIYLFRDMLRLYQRCSLLDKLANTYYKILKIGVTWDQEMYNCVINCCARALPVDELSRLFDEMLHRGFSPNTITTNVMLDIYGKSKLFNKARSLFSMAQKRGLLDVISYNTVIAAFGKSKDLENMSKTARQMQFNGFSVSLEAYNCMLDAYGKEGQMENFQNVLQRMKESTCRSDRYTYNTIINIYGEQGWIDEVSGVLEELQECGGGADLYSYNTMIKAYGIAGMVEEAVMVVKEMRRSGIEPDKITYINMITALRRNDKFLEAVKWSLWMKQMNL